MAIKNGRYISEYIINIMNESPMNVAGNNDAPLVDLQENKVYIPGTTIAGAFKSYVAKHNPEIAEKMFGNNRNNQNIQSRIFIYDSFAILKQYEIRSAVNIDERTGTNNNKFERTFIASGHKFEIKVEVYADDEFQLRQYNEELCKCILALEEGIITLGSYKSIGAGRCRVSDPIKRINFNLNNKQDLFKYLKEREFSNGYEEITIKFIKENTKVNNEEVIFSLEGKLRTPLLIKGYSALNSKQKDSEQLLNSNGEPIVPGSSLKGVIRAEVKNILDYFNKDKYFECLFGTNNTAKNTEKDNLLKISSKITAYDSIIKNPDYITYNKIRIDRFTGGTRRGALTQDTPVKGDIRLEVKYNLAKDEELNSIAIAAISLVFRDICIGNIPLGGENNIGRGRIEGTNLKVERGSKIIFDGDIVNDKIITNNLGEYLDCLNKKEVISK